MVINCDFFIGSACVMDWAFSQITAVTWPKPETSEEAISDTTMESPVRFRFGGGFWTNPLIKICAYVKIGSSSPGFRVKNKMIKTTSGKWRWLPVESEGLLRFPTRNMLVLVVTFTGWIWVVHPRRDNNFLSLPTWRMCSQDLDTRWSDHIHLEAMNGNLEGVPQPDT